MYKYVFLDLDDTIWDFHGNARLSLKDVFDLQDLHRYCADFENFYNIYAQKNKELWVKYAKGEVTQEFLMMERFRYPLAEIGINDEKLAKEIGNQYLDILPTKKNLMPHARETLDYLAAKYPLTLVSNGFTEVQFKKMRSSGIEHYFAHTVLSEFAGALKPDKKIFEYALQLNGARPDETVMLGDNYETDICGAQNADIAQIYFPLAFPAETPPCTHIIRSLDEVREIL
ncbi:MAG: YjjG family noncanonical pyrimidine nucleotidase [Paludibacter sp.]|jgi:putative hydrolase of the HAD superfamily|nr:YjjG family noncanonical pyrimidine nucleotidase [Paludibacter sp.]